MFTELEIRSIIEKYSLIPLSRFRFARSVDELLLPTIQRGIIFVLATWSGPALFGLKRFTKVIHLLDPLSIDIIILDIDCLTEETASELFGVPSFTTGGWGETIWIRDGHVTARALAHAAPETLIEQNTRALFSGDRA